MGWSCSAVASNIMDELSEKSFKKSGLQNVYEHKGNWFMWEVSRKEHEDGSITGSIHKFVEDPRGKDRTSARRVGNFKIDGRTGKVKGSYGLNVCRR